MKSYCVHSRSPPDPPCFLPKRASSPIVRLVLGLLCAGSLTAALMLASPLGSADGIATTSVRCADVDSVVSSRFQGVPANVWPVQDENPLHADAVDGRADVSPLFSNAAIEVDAQSLSEATAHERFDLYDACRPLNFVLVVQSPDDDLVQGSIEEDVQVAVESRLRTARLYDSEASSHLRVYVHIVNTKTVAGKHVGWQYCWSIDLGKPVLDLASGELGRASTWERRGLGSTGTNVSGLREDILAMTRRNMDEFLAEYLRANEEACE